MNKKTLKSKRLATATLGLGLAIALSSCSGATNTYGSIPKETYATSGDYTLSAKELWKELQWSANEVLEEQLTTVVLTKYADRINTVETVSFDNLTADDFEDLGIDTTYADKGKKAFEKIKEWYDEELTNYVIFDIYNLTYDAEGYDDAVEKLTDTVRYSSEIKYVDEMYSTYQVEKIGSTPLKDLVVGSFDRTNKCIPDSAKANYLTIANSSELKSIYYEQFAKKLLAFEKHSEEVYEDDEDDSDSDDTDLGHYSYSNYSIAFEEEYVDTNDVEAIMICFTSDDEYNATLKAFGLKYYNNQLYYIKDKKNNMTYSEYEQYYDDFSNAQLNSAYGAICVDNSSYAAILEIYVQLYNYIYSGYRNPIRTGNIDFGVESVNYSLDTLRTLTRRIIEEYTLQDDATKYANAIANIEDQLKDADSDENTRITYTYDELQELGSSMVKLLYTTLDSDDISKSYAQSTTSTSNGSYIAYKLGEIEVEDETTKKHANWYDSILEENDEVSNLEIISYILDEEKKYNNLDEKDGYGFGSLKYTLERELILEDIATESAIQEYVDDEIDRCKVKIYNEATEIAYSVNHSGYSNTIKKNSNSNVLATIKYRGTKYNLYIYVGDDTKTKNSVTKLGTDEAIGVYNILEQKDGCETAITLLSNKMIKDTEAYKETKKYNDDYEDYIDNILLNFSNDGYSSSGYPSSIGKYNFLMLYFHSANIKSIIKNHYRLQAAATKLLADYSNDQLIEFLKNYTDTAYEKYFSLTATRLYVYFDGNDDGSADKVSEWNSKKVEDINSPFYGETLETVAKNLIYDIYTIISSSTDSHTDKVTSLVEEINSSARVEFENNPIKSEALWAKYRHLGLKVQTADLTATNASTDIPYSIKQRLYDYANGEGKYIDATGTEQVVYYQYFLEDSSSVPTCYIEPLNETDATSSESDQIVESIDGYNLILVTDGTVRASAEWLEKDNDEKILENLILIYNDEMIKIDNIYTDEDASNPELFTLNQIKLYILDYIINGSSTLMPSEISSAVEAFLSPVVTRFTATETQRIVVLSFIKMKTNQTVSDLTDVIKFANESYNNTSEKAGLFKRKLEISEKVADGYTYIYGDKTLEQYGIDYDTTGTYDLYTFDGKTWWDYVSEIVDNILTKEAK
ncbi:MAG: hypothetical protein K6E20_06345 [Acholeplasmatales bacterium]|nr:hypothetical protein [Acholeplasmatales bacterium]